MARNKRRHKAGFGYGTGANNQSNRPFFSEIKHKLNSASYKAKSVDFDSNKLSAADRVEIKNKVRKSNEINTLKIWVITISIVIVLLIIAMEIVKMTVFKK